MITLTVTGHLTGDAILRDYNGTKVLSFSIASNNRYKNQDAEVIDETTFIRCAVWNATPATKPILFKGRLVSVTGTMKTSVYGDKVNIDLRVINFQVFGKGNQEEEMQTTASPGKQQTAKTQPANVEKYGERNDPNDELLNHITIKDEVTDDLPF